MEKKVVPDAFGCERCAAADAGVQQPLPDSNKAMPFSRSADTTFERLLQLLHHRPSLVHTTNAPDEVHNLCWVGVGWSPSNNISNAILIDDEIKTFFFASYSTRFHHHYPFAGGRKGHLPYKSNLDSRRRRNFLLQATGAAHYGCSAREFRVS